MVQIIRQVKTVDGMRKDIAIEDGSIIAMEATYEGDGEELYFPEDVYASPGWIDIHTHAFPKFEPYCAHADQIGYPTGVTTVVDAGSSGYEDIAEFYEMKQSCQTRVFSFLNVSKIGLKVRDELADLKLLAYPGIEKAYRDYPKMIVGLKARMSASVIGRNGLEPLRIARYFSEQTGLPLMVHIGSAPPAVEDVLNELAAGDIVTHFFHQKYDNHLFGARPAIKAAVQNALSRGVYFDIGHGTSSFSFRTAGLARQHQIPFHSISTDIYEKNQLDGPVYGMATTMTKFLALGHSLASIIQAVTELPANMIRQAKLGKLAPGYLADITFFKVEQRQKQLIDSFGNELIAEKVIKPYATMIGGEYFACTETDPTSD